ncbi:MAG: hypothetical protein WDO73_17805 [Ignavibacteriota bacterium]
MSNGYAVASVTVGVSCWLGATVAGMPAIVNAGIGARLTFSVS